VTKQAAQPGRALKILGGVCAGLGILVPVLVYILSNNHLAALASAERLPNQSAMVSNALVVVGATVVGALLLTVSVTLIDCGWYLSLHANRDPTAP
jgi:hypothetical protein